MEMGNVTSFLDSNTSSFAANSSAIATTATTDDAVSGGYDGPRRGASFHAD
ncbi:hypothetical protein LIER_17261 [Lithospermum erythrorhizon]|uniref:Uncharacterized protein n=1 Tax=Lithospermum erythrorhizon TaxID=34254 RepID=A0AAV3QBB2_LITER